MNVKADSGVLDQTHRICHNQEATDIIVVQTGYIAAWCRIENKRSKYPFVRQCSFINDTKMKL